jgi:hypothetical protein
LEGPSDDFRANIALRVQEIEDEGGVEELLADIESAASEDLAWVADAESVDSERASVLLAAIDSWASLGSFVVVQFYGSLEPPNVGAALRWRRGPFHWAPGWRRGVAERLQALAGVLRGPLEKARAALGATSFSISVGFPWGVSVGLSWLGRDVMGFITHPPSGP